VDKVEGKLHAAYTVNSNGRVQGRQSVAQSSDDEQKLALWKANAEQTQPQV
jgi:hypothetical protein